MFDLADPQFAYAVFVAAGAAVALATVLWAACITVCVDDHVLDDSVPSRVFRMTDTDRR